MSKTNTLKPLRQKTVGSITRIYFVIARISHQVQFADTVYEITPQRKALVSRTCISEEMANFTASSSSLLEHGFDKKPVT